ncbi:MAG: glutamate-5-semialdehyde dehydrogenase [bacterium]|nr:glutamate-5-semialdehyde dehydrogenase [bacterium]
MNDTVLELAKNAKAAAQHLATVPTETKNGVLRLLADRIDDSRAAIGAANEQDLAAARSAGLPEAKLRRLTLTPEGIGQMAAGLRQIAELDDPVGQVTKAYTVPSGLRVSKVRVPLGVVMMIYEARPNVTIDAFALCFKAGNACILKGGKEALHANKMLAGLARAALEHHGLSGDALGLLTTSDRDEIKRLLALHEQIDLVIPRGGTELIRFVHEHSRIPTVQHFQGVCHIFVDAAADAEQALEICTTAKTSAPATCNAVEAILVHADLAETFIPDLVARCIELGVEVRGDETVCRLAAQAVAASDTDWGHEFLDLIVAVKIVAGLDEAIAHIARYGSNHTDAIVTTDPDHAEAFCKGVHSSCVLVNASTRFNDGYQLGLGAEIGISTSRIHAYGPMGLEGLTIERFVVRGNGQAR